jgi:serine/threonine protein kinase
VKLATHRRTGQQFACKIMYLPLPTAETRATPLTATTKEAIAEVDRLALSIASFDSNDDEESEGVGGGLEGGAEDGVGRVKSGSEIPVATRPPTPTSEPTSEPSTPPSSPHQPENARNEEDCPHSSREDILKEIDLLAQCEHAHVMCLHEYFEEDNKVFLITELLMGGELLEAVLYQVRRITTAIAQPQSVLFLMPRFYHVPCSRAFFLPFLS